jgi:hypothetical protein
MNLKQAKEEIDKLPIAGEIKEKVKKIVSGCVAEAYKQGCVTGGVFD